MAKTVRGQRCRQSSRVLAVAVGLALGGNEIPTSRFLGGNCQFVCHPRLTIYSCLG